MTGKQKKGVTWASVVTGTSGPVLSPPESSQTSSHNTKEDVHDIKEDGHDVGDSINLDRLNVSEDKPVCESEDESEDQPFYTTVSGPYWTCNLNFGGYSEKGLQFMPLKLIERYPDEHVNDPDEKKVAAEYFVKNKFRNHWDLYFLRDPRRNGDIILLVPSSQFERFLTRANETIGLTLVIPRGSASTDYLRTFGEWDTPVPRFLGRAITHDSVRNLQNRAMELEKDDLSRLSPPRLQLYYDKLDNICDSFKGYADRIKAVLSRRTRVQKLKANSRMVKRVQRYLGLREQLLAGTSSSNDPSISSWDVNKPAPYKPASAMRFVCVDVEAMERNHAIVTEIGVAILDTARIENTAPGERGENWFSKIEAHHFRVEEYSHFVNKRYVKGCPDAFHFGKSVFVPRKSMAEMLSQVIGEARSTTSEKPIVLVGHDVLQDLKYLKTVGYSVWGLGNVFDEADTLSMFRRVARRLNGCGLQTICDELGTSGPDFHNAGNDAVYTLRAMIAMIIRRTIQGSDFLPNDAEEPLVSDDWSDGEADDGGPPQLSKEPTEPAKRAPSAATSRNIKW
ncbi:hypothetical protein F4810DRAFT_655021 [Camillea tinctor]|nr:hypothetical protein F4810DRAFT_655021 [Camillea tinctor]